MRARGWMLAGALTVTALLAVPALLTRPHHRSPEPTREQAWVAPIALGGPTPDVGRRTRPAHSEDLAVVTVRPAPEGASKVARAFLAAYLDYENGRADRATMRTLHELATSRLWHQLTGPAASPDRHDGQPSTRLTAMAAGVSAGPHQAATMLATLRRATQTHGIALTLTHQPGHWLVAAITR